jgi:spore coat polysaccharide biosynthesis predicted glycosyltransferase SpsG
MPARVRFVVAAGPTVGRGHLARALSLAEASWAHPASLELELIGDTLTDAELARAEAVGLRQVPAGEPLARAAVAVVDVPDPGGLDARFDPSRLAVFDDRDVFAESAALVIQPSMGAWSGTGEARTVLAGYTFVPISAAIRRRQSMRQSMPIHGTRPRVLVCFGGSDPAQVTGRLVPTLASLEADAQIVVGPRYRGPADGWPLPLLRDPPDLVDRLAAADVVLLGAGTMKFEAACLARPMVLLAVADDQLRVGSAFGATGAARYLGDGRTVDPAVVVEALAGLLADREARAELGAAGATLVDGLGADRIARAVEGLDQPTGYS